MIININNFSKLKPAVFYNQIYTSDFKMPVHAHDTLEIMYVEKGVMQLTCRQAESSADNIIVNAGQYVLIKPYTLHNISIPIETVSRIQNIEFNYAKGDIIQYITEECFANGSEQTILAEFPDVIVFDDTRNIHSTLIRLQKVLSSSRTDATGEYALLVAQFFLDLIMSDKASHITKRGNIHLNQALDYINQNYNYSLTADQIAKYSGVSTQYLNKLCRNELGCTIMTRLNSFRVDKAAYLLKNTGLSSLEIAKRVGYSNPQSFINNFSKVYNRTPSAFRNEHNLNYHILDDDKNYFYHVLPTDENIHE